ncbi:MAG TPA: AraC family transcriptional regulator [Puia sp.]|nr:AraC family transcriptional regulator [Puia sp.]
MKTIVLLGALQGFIVGGLLWTSGRTRPDERVSRRLLSVLILLIALCCFDIYLIHVDSWMNSMTGAILQAVIPLIIAMPIGPLLFFYVRSCEEPDFRLTRRHRRHFYPVVVDLFQHFAILLLIIALLAGWMPRNKYPIGIWEDYYDQYADIPRWISLTIYLTLANRYLRRRRKSAMLHDEAQRRFSWLKKLLRVFWVFDLIWLAFLIPYELPTIGDQLINRFDWYPLYIPLVIIIYFLGANGYFITYRIGLAPPDRKSSSIPAEKLEQLSLLVRRSMEQDRLWLDADLSLGKLAQHCGIAPKTLSMVLNQWMGVSFADLVNSYRVDAVKERILLPESRQLTIAGLAYECGFNSLPTFQRAFKATTGMSPKEYLINSGMK